MKFSHTFRVSARDIDEQGHVNNVSFVRWVQDVAVAHWLNETTSEQQEKYAWVMLRHEIDYKKQAFASEEITATTWVGRWTAVTCERFTEICRGTEVLVRSRTICCMLDRQSSKPARISAELRALF